MNLLQIYCRVSSWKNFENRIIVGEIMAKSLVSCFFDSRCIFNFFDWSGPVRVLVPSYHATGPDTAARLPCFAAWWLAINVQTSWQKLHSSPRPTQSYLQSERSSFLSRSRQSSCSQCCLCGDAENATHEFAGHENAAPCCRGGKCETRKCEKHDSMEHRVLHVSVHCRAGMHFAADCVLVND